MYKTIFSRSRKKNGFHHPDVAILRTNGIHHPDVAILRTNTVVVIVILVKTIKCNLLDNGKGLNVNTSCCININGIMFAVSVYFGIWLYVYILEYLTSELLSF